MLLTAGRSRRHPLIVAAARATVEPLEDRRLFAAGSYAVETVTLGGVEAFPRDFNAAGQVVGEFIATGETTRNAFSWEPGDTAPTEIDPSAPVGSAAGVSEAGQVVGSFNKTTTSSDGTVAFVWSQADGVTRVPNTLAGTGGRGSSRLLEINSAGTAVGFANFDPDLTNDPSVLDQLTRAVRWTSAGGYENLGALADGTFSTAKAINEAGQAAGISFGTTSQDRAVRWEAGSTTPVLLGVPTGADYTQGNDINASGVVVGGSGKSTTTLHATVWDAAGNATLLDEFDGVEFSTATGVNDAGVVVGRVRMTDGTSRGFVWEAGTGMRDINDLVTLPAGSRIAEGTRVTADGRIVALTEDAAAVNGAAILTPQASSILSAAVTTELPTPLVIGQKVKGRTTVTVTNAGPEAMKGTVSVTLYFASDPAATTGVDWATARKKLSLKVGAAKAIGFKKFPVVPAGLTAGTPYLLARVEPAAGVDAAGAFAAGPQQTVEAPVVTFQTALALTNPTKSGSRRIVVALTLANDGNVTAKGSAEVDIYASADGTTNGAVLLQTARIKKVSLATGRAKASKFKIDVPLELSSTLTTIVTVLRPTVPDYVASVGDTATAGPLAFVP